MERFRQHLVGKISGAVGTHNAEIALGFARRSEETESERLTGQDGASFEERVLRKLGLKPAPISTQILPPEPLAYYLHAAVLLSAALGQFGRDCRHLMRSEVGEIAESFEEGQVGSSTMAQKRNPTRFENLEGMYLRSAAEYEKVLATLISEHQRDLVGSSVMRDFPVIIVNLVYQLETLLRKNDKGISFLRRIAVNEDACRRNLAASESTRLAEPFYIALQMAGWQGDAHELINRRAVPMCTGATSLHHAVTHLANEDPELKAAFCRIPDEVRVLLCRPDEPERYAGNAAKQAQMIAHQAEKKIIEWTS